MVGLWEGVPASPCSGASDDAAARLRSTRSRRTHAKRTRSSSYDCTAAPAEFVGAERASDKDAQLVAKLNITAADERRKLLLHQLRVIDRKKALLKSLASGGSAAASAASSRDAIIEAATPEPYEEPEPKARSSTDLTLDVSAARGLGSTDVARFCASPSPSPASTVHGSPLPSPRNRSKSKASSPSISYADLPTRRSSRRVTRPRTPSVLLDRMPGDTVLRKLPVGVLKCKRYVFCKKVISLLYKNQSAAPFSAPVKELWRPEAIPRYFDVITRPMDLGTIKKNLEGVCYLNTEETNPLLMFKPNLFADDVRLVFRNAMIYNKHGDVLYNCASDLLAEFESMWKTLPELPSRDDNRKKRQAPNGRPLPANKRGRIGDVPTSARPAGKAPPKAKKSPRSGCFAVSVTKLDESLTPRQLRKRLDYLRKCRIALRARTVLPKGATFYDRGALLQDVPLSHAEKNEIAKGVKRLSPSKLSTFLSIIKHDTDKSGDDEEEIELEISALDTKTQRTVEAFLESVLSNYKTIRNSSIGEEFETTDEFEPEIQLIEKRLAATAKQSRSPPRKSAPPPEPEPEPAAYTAPEKDSEELYASSDSDSDGSDDSDGSSGSDSD